MKDSTWNNWNTLLRTTYGTAQMQLHTHECQTRELNIVTCRWIVMTRESYFAYSRVQFLCMYLVFEWSTRKLHTLSVYTCQWPHTLYLYKDITNKRKLQNVTGPVTIDTCLHMLVDKPVHTRMCEVAFERYCSNAYNILKMLNSSIH